MESQSFGYLRRDLFRGIDIRVQFFTEVHTFRQRILPAYLLHPLNSNAGYLKRDAGEFAGHEDGWFLIGCPERASVSA